MFKEVLQSIGGVHVYPIVSLLLFLAAFSAVVIWVMTIKRKDLQRWSSLPLDSGDEPTDAGER